MGQAGISFMLLEEDQGDGDVSNDDPIEESIDGTWFWMGMSREEKIEVQRPWRNRVIVKLVRRTIG